MESFLYVGIEEIVFFAMVFGKKLYGVHRSERATGIHVAIGVIFKGFSPKAFYIGIATAPKIAPICQYCHVNAVYKNSLQLMSEVTKPNWALFYI